jgi:hypothetical protein
MSKAMIVKTFYSHQLRTKIELEAYFSDNIIDSWTVTKLVGDNENSTQVITEYPRSQSVEAELQFANEVVSFLT